MEDPTDRTDRFELIAAAGPAELADLANAVLETGPKLSIRQEPRPQLLLSQVREPVERRPFNLGEAVATPAEVTLDGARGFAMVPGKAERAALSGAIVDAAVAGDHPVADEATERLSAVGERDREQRRQEWARTRHTAVDFRTMEDQQ
ncbi:phosphonate C-P lyase system protein PhnG [Halorhabdus amylolytica]|uniref:phosphonate C-P lyase system protein PhnG n=1 Tax=Halorhabdus amylolytica TaxID=2559573 RepID=UPI0010AA554B|nr:phosphonate C-P lyase system protein PhnG [Halorhabdus amylolytica]